MSKNVKEIMDGIASGFDGSSVSGENANFHFIFSENEEKDYTVSIVDGKCTITEGLDGDADCTINTSAKTFVDVIEGRTNPTMAVMTGGLRVSNIGVMMKFAKPFGLM